MEKKRRWFCFIETLCLKNVKLIKCAVALMFCCFLLPEIGFAQQQKVTLSVKDVEIQQVFKEINKQTQLNFVYNAAQMNEFGKVTLNVNNESIDAVLSDLFKGSAFGYKFEMQSIVIYKKKKDAIEEISLTGMVYDESGLPLPGVTVFLKNTTMGGVTDNEGKFALSIPKQKDLVLVFSFIGKKRIEHPVVSDKPIEVVMIDEVETMEEVVVTGYGNINTKSFTGNAKTIQGEDLLKVSRTNIMKAIQVFDPSFKITENNLAGADPNKLPEVTIRGRSSLGAMELDKLGDNPFSKQSLEANPNTPTFVIDGFEVDIRKVYDLDPNRIQSVTILKDAAATAMYGSRAANGVVVITTRLPESGDLQVSYTMTGTIEMPDLSGYNLMNAKEKLEAERLSGVFDYNPEQIGGSRYSGDELYMRRWNAIYVEGVETDWMALPLRTAFRHDHSLQIEGGSKAIRYGLILDYSNDDGVMRGSKRNTWGGEFNIHLSYKKMFLRNSVSYHYTSSADSPYGSFRDFSHQMPYVKYKDRNGRLLKELTTFEQGSDLPNPMYEASLNNFTKTAQHELMDNLQLRCSVTDYLMLQGSVGVTMRWNDDNRFIDPLSKYSSKKISVNNLVAGDLFTDVGTSSRVNVRLGVSVNKTFNKHNLNLALNGEMSENQSSSVSTHYVGFPSGKLSSVNYASEVSGKPSKSETTSRAAGLNGILNYSWDDIYLLDLSFRYEGSSVFGTEKKGAPYWAGGVGINFHNYQFFENLTWLNRFRLRGSYGVIGNINFPAYAARNYFVNMFDDWYINGYGTKITYLGNHSLKPEKTRTLDVGVDFSFLQDKLNFKLSYYNKTTIDMVNDVTVPTTSGFSVYKDNLGEVRNKGIEFDIYTRVLNYKDFSLSLSGNIAHNKNTMLKIGKSLEAYNRRVEEYYDNSDRPLNEKVDESKIWTKYTEGASLTAQYGMRSLGIDPATGREIFLNKKGDIVFENDPKEYVVIGDTEPKGSGSLGLYLTYKNLTFTTNFSYEFGSKRYNETLVYYVENASIESSNVDKRVLSQRWQKPGDRTPLKNIKDRYEQTRPTSRFMQNYNMFSLTSMSLQYELDRKFSRKFGMDRIRFEVGCGELFQLCSVKRERGLDYPFARNFNFNIMVNF